MVLQIALLLPFTAGAYVFLAQQATWGWVICAACVAAGIAGGLIARRQARR